MLTILTPLYNRKQFLPRLFENLSKQTNKDFCWLIIDDGSDERSDSEVSAFNTKADFNIEYYYKENGGKHTALNYAHEYIDSGFVLILDSDDLLTPDAVETVHTYANKYAERSDIGIISFQRGSDTDHPYSRFPNGETESDCISFRINQKRKGDCCEVIKAEVLKKYPFPVFDGENFMDEAHLWIGSADEYKTVYVAKVIYICEYLDGGLTLSGREMRAKSPLGGMHSQIIGLNPRCCFSYRARRAMLLIYYGHLAGYSISETCKLSGHPAFVRLFVLPGLVLVKIFPHNKE